MANTASMANMIKAADVTRAYRGRKGCTCGCRGKYFEPGSKGLAGVVRDVNARIDEAYRYTAGGEKHVAIRGGGKILVVALRRSANVAFLPTR